MTHWHIATGLAGYGPEGAEGFATAVHVTSGGGLADQVSQALRDASESAGEYVSGYADAAKAARERGDGIGELDSLRDYLAAVELSEDLHTRSLNFGRGDAPLYRNDKGLWEKTVLRMVAETFPLDISHNTRLYVWECEFPNECQHIGFDCKRCSREVYRDGEGGYIDDGHNAHCFDGTPHDPDLIVESNACWRCEKRIYWDTPGECWRTADDDSAECTPGTGDEHAPTQPE